MSTNDRELLEMAAKAAGLVIMGEQQARRDRLGCGHIGLWVTDKTGGDNTCWNPLEDDGDALRLAVRRRFHVCIFSASQAEGISTPGFVEVWRQDDADPLHVEYVQADDYEAATRRAIVRAAAEIGRAMP